MRQGAGLRGRGIDGREDVFGGGAGTSLGDAGVDFCSGLKVGGDR